MQTDIKRAKEEIKHTVCAYLSKDEYGRYRIAPVHQRPILLLGAPGIGKTAIMEQIARECGIALVSYSITHHTRQSAIGLPMITKKQYGGKEYSVTEYTMSEIIAAVYDKMKESGLTEGLLFLDEINCVSETLAPAMLQFLQNKCFGTHRLPEGWLIVTAGNPPEYNKSVRTFDVVTLDRLKKMEVSADFSVWKEYAYRQGLHGAILSYLKIKKQHFYVMETTVDGKRFVTPRGWEDLSEILYLYEEMGIAADEAVMAQYLQHDRIAKDFANYYDLYQKYRSDYRIELLLSGNYSAQTVEKLRLAPFDERLSIVGLLLSRLGERFLEAYREDLFVTRLHALLTELKERLFCQDTKDISFDILTEECLQKAESAFQRKKQAGLSEKEEENAHLRTLSALESFLTEAKKDALRGHEAFFSLLQTRFSAAVSKRQTQIDETKAALESAFSFLDACFGEGQELVVFLTELSMHFYGMRFISENGCETYHHYNHELLLEDKQKNILQEIETLKNDLPQLL